MFANWFDLGDWLILLEYVILILRECVGGNLQLHSFCLLVCLFIFRERERESGAGEGQRERIPSRFCAVSAEPTVGLELAHREIMT